MAQSPQGSRPKIVLLSLEKQPWLDEMYGSLLTQLKATADVTEIIDRTAASALFTGDYQPKAVIVTDAALTTSKYSQQRAQAAEFVREGGNVIFGLHFPSCARPPDIKRLFTAFSFTWEAGDYHRTNFDVNPTVVLPNTTGLVPR